MKNKFFLVTAILLTIITVSFLLCADAPKTIIFQGNLTNSSGAPLNSAVNLTFRLYDVETGGSVLWTEVQNSVTVTDGIFTSILGKSTTLSLPFDKQYWISLQVNTDNEMTPRTSLNSSPYAFRATVADSVLASNISGDTMNVGNGKLVIDNSGNVGIGTSSPSAKLEVNGSIKALDTNNKIYSVFAP